MIVDFTPKERFEKITEILAGGVMTFLESGFPYISFLSVASITEQINLTDIVYVEITNNFN